MIATPPAGVSVAIIADEWCRSPDLIRRLRALDTFPQHSPITELALAKVRGARIPSAPPHRQWRELTASAMEDIITETLRTDPERPDC